MMGHRFILEEFGKEALPKIGWQIDQFGHSEAAKRIFAELGFTGMVGNRIAEPEKEWRR